MHIGWPQGIWIGLTLVMLLVYAAADGKPKTGNYSLAGQMLGAAITAALLIWGGFFS